MAQTCTKITWLLSLFTGISIKHNKLAVIWCGNFGARHLASNPVFHLRIKHIEIDVHFRDKVMNKDIKVRYASAPVGWKYTIEQSKYGIVTLMHISTILD